MSEKPLTILVVDDTDATRYAVSRILQKAHFLVREAKTGHEGLRLSAEKPDLIILDVQLPDINGYEVCQRIKADPATASIPVLHLSASFVESDSRAHGLESGADGYLVYPLEPRELVANVKALLRIREAEKRVRAQRELLRVTLSSIGDGVVATDAQGFINFINPVAQQLTGWTEAEALGKKLDEIVKVVQESTGEPIENLVYPVLRLGKTASVRHGLLVARDGRRQPIDDTAAAILDDEGQFVGVVLVFRDVTERRRLENELQNRQDALVERDRRKDEFLAMLAHELRNPLAPIRNTLQILKFKFRGDLEFEQPAGVMERQLTHLVRLVDDLMDVSRISQGKFELRKQRSSLQLVLERAIEAVRSFLEERHHQLEVKLPAEELELEADPARLEQIFSNLLSNAAKYTPANGLIRLTAQQEGNEAVIQVTDNGIGIRPEMFAHIFDLFQQADRVPGKVSEGLGIGLSLVRSLAVMHGGSVSGFSAGPGQGSQFVVRLPLLARQEPRQADPVFGGEPEAGRSLRILITDDNVDSAESMARLLRLYGHEVRTAYNGAQALELAQVFCPQAMLLDIGLPGGMDGYEVARRLRRQEATGKVLLVATTGFGTPSDIERARSAGFDFHLVKPADPVMVQQLLSTLK